MTLRVGILTYDFHPHIGGQGRVTYDLWRRLRERDDIDVTVISPARNTLPGHRTRYAPAQRYGRHPLFSLLASASIRRWAAGLRLDVLHVNGGPGGVLLLRDAGVPVVYSLYHTYAQTARLMPGHGWKWPLARLERSTYARAARLTASTESTAASLRDDLRLTAPVDVIPCGVDLEAFHPGDGQRDDDTVLFVGRLDHRKNAQLLLRAFALVARRHATARLVIAGTGALERPLRSLASSLGLGGRVTFERFVSQDGLVRWYQRAALVVVPSLFEGFGLSAAEAQACGACVVATDSEGLRDVIADGETGLLVEPAPEALAEAMLGLLGGHARRSLVGETAQLQARRVYDWREITGRWVQSYHQAAQVETGRYSLSTTIST